MSPLIDAAALESAAEFQVQAVLNTFLRKRSGTNEFFAQLTTVCDRYPDAAWHALSLLDQLHRRRTVSGELYRVIKDKLNEIVFSKTGSYRATTGYAFADSSSKNTNIVKRQSPVSANANAFPIEKPLRPGDILDDRYVIVESIRIGQTALFKAFDERRAKLPAEERYVAIRWLDGRLQHDPRAISALKNEFSQLELIGHANVPKVYELSTKPGSCYIAMEWIEGEPLSRIMERSGYRRMPHGLALTIIREIGFALAAAHRHGIVHGGLQPSDIVISTNGQLHVSGFASADRWIAPSNATSGLNKSSSVQFAGAKVEDDLFCLTCIACELLCPTLEIEWVRTQNAPPPAAKGLNQQQWNALRRGLGQPSIEPIDVRRWLRDLDLSSTYWQLPTLEAMACAIENGDRHRLPDALDKWWKRSRTALAFS